jgi:type VI secretion system FHA domain protein
MTLTLEVVSSNGQGLGAARRKVFGPDGGRIGRSADCDWVLANPYISRHHATVRCVDGVYYIESTGENRVAVNSSQASIPPFKPWELRNGDHVYLDEYEVAVTMDVAHFAPMPDAAPLMPGPESSFDDFEPSHAPPPVAAFESSDEDVDPMRRLSGQSRAPAPPPPDAKPSWNHTPGINDQYAPPPVPPAADFEDVAIPEDWHAPPAGRAKLISDPLPPERSPPAPSGNEIPEDWAKTSFGYKANPAPAPSPPAPPPRTTARQPLFPDEMPAPGRAATPTVAPRPQPGGGAARPGAAPPPPAAGEWADRSPSGRLPVPPPRPTPPASSPRAPAPPPPAPPQPEVRAQAPMAPRVAPRPPPARAPEPRETGASGFDVDAFFRAAGLDPATVPPETAAALGQIVRTIVQGVVEVLHARAEVKDQFRLAATRVMQRENNPLKFSVNAESALNFLLGRRDPAYLGPVEAFEDAMNDIRFHQLAMLSGMRAGFDHMMKHFDPTQMQQLFDKRAKRGGLLAMGAKSRYWEHYTEEFSELQADPEAAFRRVFGEAFASGYEKQLSTLKTKSR